MMSCQRPGCTGEIQDGYCNECGMAPARNPPTETELLGPQRASTQMSTSGTRPRVERHRAPPAEAASAPDSSRSRPSRCATPSPSS